MKLNYNVKGTERKSLVGAISTALNLPTKYLGMPSANYEVGDFTITKTGDLIGPDNLDLEDALHQAGFDAVEREYDEPDTYESGLGGMGALPSPEELEAEAVAPKRKGILDTLVDELNANAGDGEHWERLHKTPTIIDNSGREHNLNGTFAPMSASKEPWLGREHRDSVGEDGIRASDDLERGTIAIEMPLDGFTPEKLDNLAKLIDSKRELIKAAIGAGGTLPVIQTSDGNLRFEWFPYTENADEAEAYSIFISKLCAMAKTLQRVTSKEKTVYNQRFAFRVFLIRLGFVGDEYKAARKILLRNLSGNSSWKSGAPLKANECTEGKNNVE